MTEYFEEREDFLCYRHVLFGKRVKKFGPQQTNNRPIIVSSLNSTERFAKLTSETFQV